MRRLPPLAELEAFDAAARLGSFLAAAETLRLTPSAISHRIRGLEAGLGLQLFVREHRRIRLSEAGARYHQRIRSALESIAQATEEMRSDGRRSLSLSVAPAFGRAWLVERLTAYQSIAPQIEFTLSTATRLEPVHSGDADLAIRFVDAPPPGLQGWKLIDETVFPVCRADLGRTLKTPADLLGARLIRHPLLSWAAWLRAAGIESSEPEEGPRYDDGALMLDACAAGLGVALAPATLAAPLLASGQLVRPFDIALHQGSFYLLAAPAAQDKPWVIAFARWLTAAARES